MSVESISLVVDALAREGQAWRRIRREIQELPQGQLEVDASLQGAARLKASTRALDAAVEIYLDAVLVRARLGGASEEELDEELERAYARVDRALERRARVLAARTLESRLSHVLHDARDLLEQLASLGSEEQALDAADQALEALEQLVYNSSLSQLERALEL